MDAFLDHRPLTDAEQAGHALALHAWRVEVAPGEWVDIAPRRFDSRGKPVFRVRSIPAPPGVFPGIPAPAARLAALVGPAPEAWDVC